MVAERNDTIILAIIMEFCENDAPPLKRRRHESLGPVDINWPLGVEPSYADELHLRQFLILSRHETGKGIELPKERQLKIEREASALCISVPQALQLRHLYMKQLVRGGDSKGDESDTNEIRTLLRGSTEQFLKWQWQVHVLNRLELEKLGQTDSPDIVIPDGGCIINGRVVHWIDCIASYGASSLAKDPNLYISSLYLRAESYCSKYGPGAFMFLFGYSRDLLHTLQMDLSRVMCLGAQPINTRELIERCFPSEEGLCREEIDFPTDRVGLVIGQSGHTIRELMAQSHCDIVVHRAMSSSPNDDTPASHPTSKIVLTSPSGDHIRTAIELIERVVYSTDRFYRRVLCLIEKVGIIVGKQGATVREIMRQSGCSIKTHKDDLSSDGKYQIFVASGPTEENALYAETLMHAVMKSGKAVLYDTSQSGTAHVGEDNG